MRRAAAPRATARAARRGWSGRRWLRIGALASGALFGLPVAHAFFGDLGALALAVLLLGFALGRWTGPGG